MISWLRRLGNRNAASSITPTSAPAPEAAALHIPHDKIAARAYEIWVRKGKPHGQDHQNWAEAEAELRTEFAADPAPEPPPRKPR